MPDTRSVIRTRQLEALIIGAYVRGLSDESIERLVAEAGVGTVSTSTVARVCTELGDRYRAFLVRSLAGLDVFALHLEASCVSTRPSGAREGILVAWGYTAEGSRVLLDVRSGWRERQDDWLELCRRLAGRGLRAPDLVISDDSPELIRTIQELWPHADRQLCTGHRWRQLQASLPRQPDLQERMKAAYWSALDEASSAADAETRLRALVEELGQHAGAAACLAEDLPSLCTHLTYPLHLRRPLRSTNLLRRSLDEICRRAKAIGSFPGETSCLSLCWAVLDLVMAGSRDLRLSGVDRQHIAQRRRATRARAARELIA